MEDDPNFSTLKRQHNFEQNIVTQSKKLKFLCNLNFWQQNLNPGNSDLAGQLYKLTRRIESNNGPDGSR